MKMRFQFEADYDSNVLWGKADDGLKIVAKVEVPFSASGDYGYITMKKAILEKIDAMGLDVEATFWYDGQEQLLYGDADADVAVDIDITD